MQNAPTNLKTNIQPIVYLQLNLRTEAKHAKRSAKLAKLAFAVSITVYVTTGVTCLFFPPKASMQAGNVEIPSSARCFRCGRNADYATVDVSMGSPRNQMSLLLRLDTVSTGGDSDLELVLFNQETVESTSIECDSYGICTDVVLVTRGPRSDFEQAVARFQYLSKSVASAYGLVSTTIANVDGEFRLKAGFQYWLTSTHFCLDSVDNSTNIAGNYIQASIVDPTAVEKTMQADMLNNEAVLEQNQLLAKSPAVSMSERCNLQNISLFPAAASSETTWLSVFDARIYNSEPLSVELRRQIAELGVDCAQQIDDLNRSLSLYRLDCLPWDACRSKLTLPFRRVATASIHVGVNSAADISVSVKHEHALENLPRLANSNEAFLLSIAKLFLIGLSTAIVYIRSKRRTAFSPWLIRHCVEIASLNVSHPKAGESHQHHVPSVYSVAEDAFIGVLAFSARILVVVYQFQKLTADGQNRLALSEVIAGLLSFVHWFARYVWRRDDEIPTGRLGGSTAIIDSTSAVMLSFCEPPILVVAVGKFQPTARMLIALLISITAVWRVAFSATCCAILWHSHNEKATRGKDRVVLMISCFIWILQSSALAILMADAFVTPSVFSITRTFSGETLTPRLLLFFAVTAAGLPRLNQTIRKMRDSCNKKES